MKKSYLVVLGLLLTNALVAQTWLPVGSSTPYVSGSYSVNNKAYTLFRDTVNDVLYASGQFDTAGAVQAKGVATWNGNSWKNKGTDQVFFSSFAWYNGELYAGGEFNGGAVVGLFKLSGSAWSTVQEVPGGSIACLKVYNGDLYVGGKFDAIGGVTSTNIAKYNGNTWTAIPAGTSGSDRIADMMVYNGELYIAGAKELGKWNGSAFTDIHFGLQTKAYALALYKNEIYVGGGGGVAKFTGSSWTVVGGGADKDVFDLCEFNGDLYAGGQFGTINSQTIKKIAKWNGSTWSTTGNLSDVFNLSVYKNQICAVGDFGAARLNIYSGMFEVETAKLASVFPNPANGKFTVSLINATATANLKVSNLLGEALFNGTITNSQEIDLSNEAKGCYLVSIQNGTQVQTHKVFIQ